MGEILCDIWDIGGPLGDIGGPLGTSGRELFQLDNGQKDGQTDIRTSRAASSQLKMYFQLNLARNNNHISIITSS